MNSFSLSNILKKLTFFILLITISICLVLPNVSAGDDLGSDLSYLKQKKVVVLLDNSGSMENTVGSSVKINGEDVTFSRMDYALYSLGILSSTLNADDSLFIVPLNSSGLANVDKHITVDLTNSNREQAVNNAYKDLINITNHNGSYYYGVTPFGDITKGVYEAEPKNSPVVNALKLLDAPKSGTTSLEENNTEYWFIVLSDGDFDIMGEKNPKELNNHLTAALSPYQELHTIYIGFTQGVDLSSTSFVNSVSNSAYLANDGTALVETMKKVASQVSGKFDLSSTASGWDQPYSVNEDKITIELSKVEFSIKNVLFTLQESDVSLKSIELIEGNNTTTITSSQISTYSQKIDKDVGSYKCITGKITYNDQIFPNDNNQKLVLTFNGNVENTALTLLVEPTLEIETYYEYFNSNNKWEECDKLFISSNLKPGDKIRVGYRIKDKSKDQYVSTNLFNYSKLTCNGVTYAALPDESNAIIELDKEKNELSLEVSIIIDNVKKYSLYSTAVLDIQDNPTTFRVEGTMINTEKNNKTYQNITFNVFADDVQVNKQSLLNEYDYQLSITEPNALSSAKVDKNKYTISEDGTITYQISCDSYGDYKAEFKILRNSTGALRGKTVVNSYIPQKLKLEYIGDDVSLSELNVANNETPMKFNLTSDGKEFSFTNELIEYRVILEKGTEQIDVTSHADVNGSVLSFVPNKDSLGKNNLTRGELTLNVEVICDKYENLSTFTFAKININEPVYKIEVITLDNDEINLFNLKSINTTILIKFTVDGECLTAKQINDELTKDNIEVDYKMHGPTRIRKTTVNYEGDDVLKLEVKKSGISIFRPFLASLASDKDSMVEIEYYNTDAETKIEYKNISIVDRIITWIVYILILLTIVYIGILIYKFIFKKSMLFRGSGHACIVFTNNRVNIIPINTTKDRGFAYFKKCAIWITGIDKHYSISVDDVNITNNNSHGEVEYNLSNCQAAFINKYNDFSDYAEKLNQIVLKISELYWDEQVIDSEITYRDLASENHDLFRNDYQSNDKNPYSLSKQELTDIFNERECDLDYYSPDVEYDFDTSRYFVEYRRGEVIKVIKFI